MPNRPTAGCGLPVTMPPDSVADVASELPLAEQLGYRADDRLVILPKPLKMKQVQDAVSQLLPVHA